MMRIVLLLLSYLLFCHLSAQTYNYYFGNLHAHTAFSDGNKDSLISGVSKPDGSYAYAKLSNNFDFLGISEHNHYSSIRNPGFKRPLYQVGINMANAANQNGTFLALFGMEYGVSSAYNGHLLIYGFNQLIGWETSVPGVAGNNYDVFNAKSDYDGIFKKVKNNPASFCYLAHPWYSDYSSDGTVNGGLANSPYNATYDSAIVGMPLRSGIATSTLNNYSDYSQGDYFDVYRKLLAIGYHLGIGYDQDNHYTNFGRSNGGRLVIMAPSLTRANLITAMQKMHFYGSDDSNTKIDFKINGSMIGSIISGTTTPTIVITHNDPDGETADSIKIWRGTGSNSFFNWSTIVYTSLQNNTATFTDNNLLPGIEYHYFVEIKQTDGQRIVTSPIWYTRSASSLSIKEVDNPLKINYFYAPNSQLLSISVSEFAMYNISICDFSGRKIIEKSLFGKDTVIDLSDLMQGVYILRINNGSGFVSKKVIKE